MLKLHQQGSICAESTSKRKSLKYIYIRISTFQVAPHERDPAIGDVYCKKCVKDVGDKKFNKLQTAANGYDTSPVRAQVSVKYILIFIRFPMS